MMKKMISLLTAMAMMLSLGVIAYAEERNDIDFVPYADALFALGLFKGTGSGYALEDSLTREQAVTMVVRLLGKEAEAIEMNFPHPFDDVSPWADATVGYGYAHRITSGIGNNKMGALDLVTEEQFLTFLLRILGYEDGVDFTWDAPHALAHKLGLVLDDIPQEREFTRGDAVLLSWRLLNLKTKDGGKLFEDLIKEGVFTRSEFNNAKKTADGEEIVTPPSGGSSYDDDDDHYDDGGSSSGGGESSGSGGDEGGSGDTPSGGDEGGSGDTPSGGDEGGSGDEKGDNETELVPL